MLCVEMNRFKLFLLFSFVFVSNSNETTLLNFENIQTLFSDSKCIEEPSDNFFTIFSSENVEGHTSTNNEVIEFRNYRSEINKLAQYHDIEIVYNIVSEEGLSHEKVFNISLQIGDEIYHGSAKSKKKAREIAAEYAIERTKYSKPQIKLNVEDEDTNSPPTVLLNNFSFKNGYKVDYYIVDPLSTAKRIINLNKLKKDSLLNNSTFWKEVDIEQPPKPPFNVEVYVAEMSFYGKGHTIQASKHEAAMKALKFLKSNSENACSTTGGEKAKCREVKEKLKSPISLVYEESYKRRIGVEFNEISKKGPSHKPIFEFECVLGNLKYTAEGGSKKEAKRNSAKIMLANLDLLEAEIPVSEDSDSKKSKRRKKSKSMLELSKEAVGSIFSYMTGEEKDSGDDSQEKPKQTKKKDVWSPKEKLMKAASSLNINIEVHTSSYDDKGYYSLINLNLKPKYICLGTGSNAPISQEYASLNALKFLQKLDLLENMGESDLNPENFSFENFIWLADNDIQSHKK